MFLLVQTAKSERYSSKKNTNFDAEFALEKLPHS